MKPPTHPSPSRACSESVFFAALAVCLGLPPADAAQLHAASVFSGPAGLACQVAWRSTDGDGGAGAARPEVFVPLAAEALAGPGVRELLALQALLLSEFGWYLGLAGPGPCEGLLQIAPLLWLKQPSDVAAALDVGNLLGAMVLERLGPPQGPAGQAPHTP